MEKKTPPRIGVRARIEGDFYVIRIAPSDAPPDFEGPPLCQFIAELVAEDPKKDTWAGGERPHVLTQAAEICVEFLGRVAESAGAKLLGGPTDDTPQPKRQATARRSNLRGVDGGKA